MRSLPHVRYINKGVRQRRASSASRQRGRRTFRVYVLPKATGGDGDGVFGFEPIRRRIRGAASFLDRCVARAFRSGAVRSCAFGADGCAARVVARRFFVRLGVFLVVSASAAGAGFRAAERWELLRAPEATRGAFLSALERGDPDAVASYALTRDEAGRWRSVPRDWGNLLAAAYRSDPSYREWLGARLASAGEADGTLSPPFSLVRVGRSFRVYLPALYVWVVGGAERGFPDPRSGTLELLVGTGEEVVLSLPEGERGRFGPFPPVAGELRYSCASPRPAPQDDLEFPELQPKAKAEADADASKPCPAVRKLLPERAADADAVVWWLGAAPGFENRASEVLEVAVRFAVSFDEALRKRDASLLEGTSEELRLLLADMIARGELPRVRPNFGRGGSASARPTETPAASWTAREVNCSRQMWRRSGKAAPSSAGAIASAAKGTAPWPSSP